MAWSYQAPPELTDEQYARWQSLLEERTGICFLQHKSILQTGLCQRMREVGCEDYETYYDWVRAIPEGPAGVGPSGRPGGGQGDQFFSRPTVV